MAAFATPDDLADYLGRDRFSEPAEYRQAVMVLNLASGEIRAWTRQTISLVENDAVVLAGTWGSALRLPEQPVVSVSSVSFDGRSLVVDVDYEHACGILLFGTTGGQVYPQGASTRHYDRGWGGPATKLNITYTHGFSVVPDVVRFVTLNIGARLLDGIGPGVQRHSETIAGWSESITYAAGGAQGALNDAEMASLRYLRRTW